MTSNATLYVSLQIGAVQHLQWQASQHSSLQSSTQVPILLQAHIFSTFLKMTMFSKSHPTLGLEKLNTRVLAKRQKFHSAQKRPRSASESSSEQRLRSSSSDDDEEELLDEEDDDEAAAPAKNSRSNAVAGSAPSAAEGGSASAYSPAVGSILRASSCPMSEWQVLPTLLRSAAAASCKCR